MKLLKFSNALLEQGNKSSLGVMLAWHCNKIYKAVITSNPIKMMNNPIWSQFSIVCLFPDITMLRHIITLYTNKNITTARLSKSPSFPAWVFISFPSCGATLYAQFRSFIFGLTTNWTRIIMLWVAFSSKASSFLSSNSAFQTKFEIAFTSLKVFPAIFTDKISHNLSLAYYRRSVKLWNSAF